MSKTSMSGWVIRGAALIWLVTLPLAAGVSGQAPASRAERTGAELFETTCAACHGIDGKGDPPSGAWLDIPRPDFTDCAFTTVEPYADWLAIVHDGGPARGFDPRMPAFGATLSEDEILRTLRHVKAFCGDPNWAPGDLNLPRPLVTEKAFPENEAVVTTTVSADGPGSVANEVLYEKRFGSRNQLELAIPLASKESGAGAWSSGIGDLKVALKRVLHHSGATGTIISAAGEVVLPTGRESVGLGKGVTIFEPFVTAGQILPAKGFIHAQVGAEFPADRDRAAPEAFWRAALGKTFEQGRFGRSWSPIIEALGFRELESGQRVQWDLVPQMQVTLNRRQHLMINAGVRLPVTDRDTRHAQVITYLLWDWFDGGLREGW